MPLQCTDIPYAENFEHPAILSNVALRCDDRMLNMKNPSRVNVATVILKINDSPSISVTKFSLGNGIPGHSERIALAYAINKAIRSNLDGFSGRGLIQDLSNPIEEIRNFKSVFEEHNNLRITCFTERAPCYRLDKSRGELSCEEFFTDFLENVSGYTFVYALGQMRAENAEKELNFSIIQTLRKIVESKIIVTTLP